MNEIANIEFYNTPEGDVMMKELGRPAVVLDENNRPTIECMLSVIRDRYPKAHTRLMQIYSSSTMNRWYYEFRVVHRFIRCNFGEYDQHNLDINRDGLFVFEEVKCPLRGECEHEGVICRPELNTSLTEREMEVFRLIASNYQTDDIAAELHISPCTVNRHRENIKAKIKVRNVGELITYWHQNQMK
ncbi:helix-turn-helix transcriptional regulator [Phocaeicola vulgatus]|uniref:response regulator transcription factor n=1 Tax=Phocaeicola vulgatus TaxID=821 RepID=UPI001C383F71|nr:helix-turn-helix transcriptional regulator [Phocaeicola vulgatus]MBV3849537.1 helix-turn-helix transcriptional regulator [Phocaeicola vulgatus]MBV3858594.1 helix-turn-helix transcriptional regulator [Phocaeicola vulgatus]MBV3862732.1 helix-turn-helix transcriptional regulator [Phocaeicola vulgatus]MBV3870173.1 helix-turn-helix transcriptional regulator [Phocaeicola vulgatus]MBV3887709.1 helix-turn-helix transcriptional regulator [Phocaeicola vulgatus]